MRASDASGKRIRVGLRLMAATLGVGMATVAVAVLPAQVASAATFTVSNCNPTGAGSLAAEVAAATPGATVTFAPAVGACSPIVLASTLTLTKNITIAGPGASTVAVSGDDAVGVFSVGSGVTAVISGLTIEDGYASGGGILNEGILTVTDSTLSGNNAVVSDTDGGGIYNSGTLTVTDSTLSGNFVALAGEGGGIYNSGTLTVTDSTLSGNGALPSGVGGGIYNSGTATVTDSTLSGNNARYEAGGIYNSGTATVTDSTLSGNGVLNGNGGGIYNIGMVIVTDSTLSGNNIIDYGGGIYNDGTEPNNGTVKVRDSTLSDNSAGAGGGIANVGYGAVTFTNSTLSGNSAAYGGAIFNQGASVSIEATIVAEGTRGEDCDLNFLDFSFPLTDLGYNIDDDGSCAFSGTSISDSSTIDASLGSLANNGGPTQTIALLGTSPTDPAIDVVPAADCPATDQRGAPRTAPCDIGAYDTDFPSFPQTCETGTVAYDLWASSSAADFVGLFCLNAAGTGTYTQYSVPTLTPTATGTGTVDVSKTSTSIAASGKGLALLGQTTSTFGTFTETAPAPMKTGTFTLSPAV
jgi:hypothetical protein